MIRFEPPPEPPDFDETVRKPGVAWLEANPDRQRPREFWSKCLPALRDAYLGLCAYTAMHVPKGTVDHYRSCLNYRGLAYEWSNYRYAMGHINSAKGNADAQILDPHEVGDDWFEIHLPSMKLVMTEAIPPDLRDRAEFTMMRLGLTGRKDEWIVQLRRSWYDRYLQKKLTLEGLEEVAPQIARAVRKQLSKSPEFSP